MPGSRQGLRLYRFIGPGLLAALTGCLTTSPDDVPHPPRVESLYRKPVEPNADRDVAPVANHGAAPGTGREAARGPVQPVSFETAAPPPPTSKAVDLAVPPGIPGANAPFPTLPPDTPQTRTERLRVLAELYPELPKLGPDPVVDAKPGERAVPLEELQEYARKSSPIIAQAIADVDVARGNWIQVGLYPNPRMGFQGDQLLDGGPYGQIGGFVDFTLVVNGRLRLARSVAFYDYANAKLRLRKAEADLARQVRTDYYSTLVAAENVRISRLLSEFIEEVYRRQVAMVKGGQAVPFEASALRAVVGQARVALIQARNRYTSAWKQLAAALNNPDMAPAPLAGKVDEVVPKYRYEALQERLLAAHTDLASVKNQVVQAESSLVLERRRPIPDIQNNWYVQNDIQVKSSQFGVQIGMYVPVFNRNQGAILSAAATLQRLSREGERVRNDLLRQLASAFEKYEAAREQIALYREQILPDLVVAFRGVYQRYQVEPDKVNYNDIVNAQQNLATRLNDYLNLLLQQWQAASDLAGIVQAVELGELLNDPNPSGPDTWPQSGPKPNEPTAPLPVPRAIPEPEKK